MRIPTATYRVQLGPNFGFQKLAGILDYLSDLGVSDIYASPIFKARSGSAHGYDVIDPNRLNPELGTHDDWDALTLKRQALGIGWLQDIVPNHMAYSSGNFKLAELFELGPRSGPAAFFDIRWDHPKPELNGRVSAPFLGADIDQCLNRGEIRLDCDASGLFIAYYEHRFPLALKSYPWVFGDSQSAAVESYPPPVIDWLRMVGRLAWWDETGKQNLNDIKKQLGVRFSESRDIRRFVDQRLQVFNSRADSTRLAQLLQQQFFHLDFWRNADRAINYRRFFSINELIAVRQEEPEVFDQTHALVLRLTRSGVFSGLRVDHIDGLLAPGVYLDRLRDACGDCYLIVEKITAADEALPSGWPVQGTTGYEFAAHLDRLFTFSGSESQLDAICAEFCGPTPDFQDLVLQSKTEMLNRHFSGDLDNLVAKFNALPGFHADPPAKLRSSLAHILINMPVYRTYLSDGSRGAIDAEILAEAIAAAADRRNDLKAELRRLEHIMRSLSACEALNHLSLPQDDVHRLAMGAFEQLCTALAAKGVEDTALYRFLRLSALNEVGGEPQRFGETSSAFHRFAAQRSRSLALNALSTHDSKRSADVRARLLVLADIPEQWAARVKAWRQMNRAHPSSGNAGHLPDSAIEYFLYQTLVGTFPAEFGDWATYVQRIEAYMIKAAREAKHFTDWSGPDQAYEEGLKGFIDRILTKEESAPFIADLYSFSGRVAFFGRINTLAQSLIQITAPGIPDIYQGTELCDDSLVDPDNRRPVDYDRRRRCLADIRQEHERDPAGLATGLLSDGDHDRTKLYLIYVGLQTRRQNPSLFARGDYLPLVFRGPRARHAVGFARTLQESGWCVTVVPRHLSRIATPEETFKARKDIWRGTCLELPSGAPRQWRNAFTGTALETRDGMFDLGKLLGTFPVALLTAEI